VAVTDGAAPGSGTARPGADLIDSRSAWLLVLVAFAVQFVLWGTVFTYTVYASDLEAAFGLTELQTSTVYSVQLFVFFVAGGATGVLAARLRLRLVVAAAAVVAAAGVGLVQVVGSFPGVVLAMVLVGAASGATFVVTISLLPQWFEEYRGRAMGLALVGNGLGVQALPYVWLPLLDARGFRGAFLVVGGALVAAFGLAAVAYRRPAVAAGGDRGTAGDEEAGGTAPAPISAAWLRAFVTDSRFLVAMVGAMTLWTWYYVLSAGLVDILTAQGVARAAAATGFGLIGGVSVASRVVNGTLADWIGTRPALVGSVLVTAVGIVLLTLGAAFATASLVTFGIGLGGVATLFPPALVEAFGGDHASAVVGVFQGGLAIPGLLAPPAMSALVAWTGGYDGPLLVLAAITAAGAGLFWFGTRPAAPIVVDDPGGRDGAGTRTDHGGSGDPHPDPDPDPERGAGPDTNR
jgi:MFS family permease